MSKLDKLIEDALRDEDRTILEATEEQGWFQLGLSQFQGKLGWVTWTIMISQMSLFVVGVWCAYHFFNATNLLLALKWGLSATVLMLTATHLKMSLMPQMQAHRVLREVKRVELLVAELKNRTR